MSARKLTELQLRPAFLAQKLFWWCVALVAVGLLPLIYWHLIGLLNRPHYGFLYLLPFALWMLYVSADDTPPVPVSRSEALLAILGLSISAAILTTATWLWSPWIAAVSLQLALPALALGLGGWRCVRRWFPAWIFLWVLVPLPFGMDEDLIVRLRNITTALASTVLDQLGLMHDRSANVLELPGKTLFIADACSGIHSLYVLLAAALLLVALFQRGLVHTVLLLLSTFCLVLIENVARIVLVAVLWKAGHDYSAGWKHELLGVVLFVVSLLFLLSLDQLWLFFCGTRRFSILNWLYETVSGDSEKYRERFLHRPKAGSLSMVMLAVCAVYPMLAVGQLVLMPAGVPVIVGSTYDDFDLPMLNAQTLPETLNGMQREGYEEIARVPGDPLGQASRQWQYTNADRTVTALISVDYPYSGVHDLCECYNAIGWEIRDRRVVTPDSDPSASERGVAGPYAVGKLKRDLYGSGFLVFQLDDRQGKTSVVIKDLARGDAGVRATRRWESFDQVTQFTNHGLPPYVQFQLFARTAMPVAAEQEAELIQLFHDAGGILRAAMAAGTGMESAGTTAEGER